MCKKILIKKMLDTCVERGYSVKGGKSKTIRCPHSGAEIFMKPILKNRHNVGVRIYFSGINVRELFYVDRDFIGKFYFTVIPILEK